MPRRSSNDENHYLYLPVGTYSVRVYYPDYSNIRYEVVVTTEGVTVQEYGFVQTYRVTANLTGLTANVPESVEAGKPCPSLWHQKRGMASRPPFR